VCSDPASGVAPMPRSSWPSANVLFIHDASRLKLSVAVGKGTRTRPELGTQAPAALRPTPLYSWQWLVSLLPAAHVTLAPIALVWPAQEFGICHPLQYGVSLLAPLPQKALVQVRLEPHSEIQSGLQAPCELPDESQVIASVWK